MTIVRELRRHKRLAVSKGEEKPEYLEKRLAYYVKGPAAETWKYADISRRSRKTDEFFICGRRMGALTAPINRARSSQAYKTVVPIC